MCIVYGCTHIFYIHLSISEHLGCFHVLAIINYATVNKGMQITLQHSDFISYGYILNSEIAKLYVGSCFNFQRNLYIGFHSDCTNLHSCQ